MQINGQNLKIMSYNIRVDLTVDGDNAWNHRKDFFASQIQFYGPDVFGIQEAVPNQVSDIAERLSQYSFVGIAREGVGKGESSTIFYKKERLKMLLNNTFWLSETPSEISLGWDAAYKRVCTYVLFKDVKTKQLFWVFNTHLDHVGAQAKINGIKLILAKIKEVNNKNYPVICTGDLNSEPQSEGIFLLKKEMKDTRAISKILPLVLLEPLMVLSIMNP